MTTSRRTIRDIELQSQAISTLDGIFHKHYLGMFDDRDLDEYFARLGSIGVEIPAAAREQVSFYSGGHPYFLEMLGYEVVEVLRESGQLAVDEAARGIEQSFLDQYDRVIDLLREDASLNKLLQILFGPVVDAKQGDVEELLRYGLIRLTEKGVYRAFSEHFHTYLALVQREVDLWPLWRETESMLRHIVTGKLVEKYGENWAAKVEKARHPKLTPIFDACRDAQQKEQKLFGGRASQNLIDYTYPQDLFAIIFAEWETFGSIFSRDKNHWQHRADLLAKIRNPLAHNRDSSLYDYERQLAEGYCKEILTTLKAA